MSVMSGHASGSVNTPSYHVSRSLSLGKHRETWMRSDLVPAHGEDALVWKIPLIKPSRSFGSLSKNFASVGSSSQRVWML